MTMPPDNPAPEPFAELVAGHERLTARNQELESRYLHLQRTVDDLNEVVIAQGRTIDLLERKLEALVRQFGSLSERHAELRSLEEDRPPHY